MVGLGERKDNTRPPVSSLLPLGQGLGCPSGRAGIWESGAVNTNTLVRAAVWILENKAEGVSGLTLSTG